jgi:DNA-directed RNA polymerase specialized sigma24 family protein
VRACIDSGKRRRREPALAVLPDVAVADRSRQIDDADQLRRALASLPPRQRAVLVLRYFDDTTEAGRRVGGALHVPLGAIDEQGKHAPTADKV